MQASEYGCITNTEVRLMSRYRLLLAAEQRSDRACVYLQSEFTPSVAGRGPIIVHSLPCESDPTRLGSP